jgi:predicted acetyltransferase
MAGYEIRHPDVEEIQPWLRTMRTAFLDDIGSQPSEATLRWWRRGWDPARAWGAYDGGRCVSTLRTFPTTLSVPVAPFDPKPCPEIPADALTQVSVAATHRRRGILTSTLTQSLSDAKDRGEAVSVLRAAEWPIYGRFGYAVAALAADYRLNTIGDVGVRQPESPICVRQLEPAEFVGPAATVLCHARLQRPGAIERSDHRWEHMIGLNELTPRTGREPICVIAEDASGHPVGYATWTAKDGDFFADAGVEIRLHELVTTRQDAYRGLWSYVANIDLVRCVDYREKPVDEPLEFLITDGRLMRRALVGDGLWLRILDVPAALSARRYAMPGRVVLEVVDDHGLGWGGGVFVLDGSPDGAECVPAPPGRHADLTVHQTALASCYLGGRPLSGQIPLGLVQEHSPGAVGRLGAMLLSDVQPWNSTEF